MPESVKAEEIRIKALLENWADAVRRHDLAAILAHHEPDMVMFDLPPAMPEPGCSVSATILSFSPRLQRRRRSTPVMISMLLAAFDLNGAHTNAS